MVQYQFDKWREYRWYRPTDGRHYHVWLQQNLFGSWMLLKRWGSTYNRCGGSMECDCATYAAAVQEVDKVMKRRKQHGYILDQRGH